MEAMAPFHATMVQFSAPDCGSVPSVVRIELDRVIYADHNGEEKTFECDNVVVALGFGPNDDLDFCDEDFEIPSYRIGDCEKPGTILDAITAGANIAARI
jgi:hypothetical protein